MTCVAADEYDSVRMGVGKLYPRLQNTDPYIHASPSYTPIHPCTYTLILSNTHTLTVARHLVGRKRVALVGRSKQHLHCQHVIGGAGLAEG